jgi:hypothetical protein
MELAALAVPTFRMFEALRTEIEEVVALRQLKEDAIASARGRQVASGRLPHHHCRQGLFADRVPAPPYYPNSGA